VLWIGMVILRRLPGHARGTRRRSRRSLHDRGVGATIALGAFVSAVWRWGANGTAGAVSAVSTATIERLSDHGMNIGARLHLHVHDPGRIAAFMIDRRFFHAAGWAWRRGV
jgi:hypothetical protein